MDVIPLKARSSFFTMYAEYLTHLINICGRQGWREVGREISLPLHFIRHTTPSPWPGSVPCHRQLREPVALGLNKPGPETWVLM